MTNDGQLGREKAEIDGLPSPKARRRIDKLTARWYAARGEAEQYQAENRQLRDALRRALDVIDKCRSHARGRVNGNG